MEADEGVLLEDLYRDLSLYMGTSFLENHRGLERLATFFEVASGFLSVEVILWIAAIASSL